MGETGTHRDPRIKVFGIAAIAGHERDDQVGMAALGMHERLSVGLAAVQLGQHLVGRVAAT